MDHIVTTIHPFLIYQNVSVYKNGECIKNYECNLDDIVTAIQDAIDTYHIYNIDLAGDRLFSHKIEKNLIDTSKFEANELNIKVY